MEKLKVTGAWYVGSKAIAVWMARWRYLIVKLAPLNNATPSISAVSSATILEKLIMQQLYSFG